MKRTIPTVWGIIIIVLVALLVYFIWQNSFWKQVAEGKRPFPGKALTGVAPPAEVLEPSPAPSTQLVRPFQPKSVRPPAAAPGQAPPKAPAMPRIPEGGAPGEGPGMPPVPGGPPIPGQ